MVFITFLHLTTCNSLSTDATRFITPLHDTNKNVKPGANVLFDWTYEIDGRAARVQCGYENKLLITLNTDNTVQVHVDYMDRIDAFKSDRLAKPPKYIGFRLKNCQPAESGVIGCWIGTAVPSKVYRLTVYGEYKNLLIYYFITRHANLYI